MKPPEVCVELNSSWELCFRQGILEPHCSTILFLLMKSYNVISTSQDDQNKHV